MKLYISGGIAGVSNFRQVFREVQIELEEVGYEVCNPCDCGIYGGPEISAWAQNMRGDIEELMRCDGIALIPGWQQSKGASIEAELGLKLEMPVMGIEHWARYAKNGFAV